MLPTILDLATLRAVYASGDLTPVALADIVADRMAASGDPAIFITPVARSALVAAARDLMTRAPEPNSLPLWGVPFAVKDNIDVAGLPTTAACPAFAYTPDADAEVVARLKAAGALVTGKTNLDQFATGLNGTRSPYGAPRSVFDADYVSGGSSSGSAVAVAAGLASFSLGTDTAGSGRVPAAFNNLVGIKPTPGLLSTTGLVPACRSLDCITVFSATVGDGTVVRRIAEGFDPADPYSRRAVPLGLPSTGLRFGVLMPAEREFYGDAETEALYDAAIARLETLGGVAVPFDYAPFREIATLLYDGPWVAERLVAIEEFFADHAAAMDPSVRAIVASAQGYSAADAFRGRYAFETLRRRTDAILAGLDLLLLPTAPTTYSVAAMQADPIRLNSHFGRYTNFANLLGHAAIAVPAGFRADGLPGGVMLVAPSFSDEALAPWADALHRALGGGMGIDRAAALPEASRVLAAPSTSEAIELVVVGAHLTGLALNHQLLTLGATFVRSATTTRDYRLYALAGTVPAKPGLIRTPGFDGPGLAVEIWSLDPAAFGRFAAAIPAPLGIGRIALDDGSEASGFLCEAHAVDGAVEITAYGGWRAYLAAETG
ncbi:allophanate hydrolase [Methylobacterium sp. BTF04]|uniref:allophanate hydrolase n=1 Tax=Methylobacterium sp. BTF04 TaxID=2708300 RepID=UPI0013D4ABCE|nr:allophanate hydrolase [Methylobacterium sp. BTF04]NEU11945.1 allophanate hydrolase [Methylobacterium sp. BTF04]